MFGGAKDVVVAYEQIALFTFVADGVIIMVGDDVGAKCGHFENFRAEKDVRESKAPANQARVAKDALDLARARVRRDVEVFGRSAKPEITHGAADQVGLITELPETANDFVRFDVDLVDRKAIYGRNFMHQRECLIAPHLSNTTGSGG